MRVRIGGTLPPAARQIIGRLSSLGFGGSGWSGLPAAFIRCTYMP
jgi:hypothetical protein